MEQFGRNTAQGGNLGSYASPAELPKNEITSLINSIGEKINMLNEVLGKHASAISMVISPHINHGGGIQKQDSPSRSTQLGNELAQIDANLSVLLTAIDELTQSVRI